MGVGVIRFQADGFLELADRLVGLAFLVEGDAEVVVREVIVLRDFERMPEQGFTVLPITKLLPRQRQAEDDRRTTRHRQRQHLIPPASGQFVRAPDREDQHPKRRKISIAIRHRLSAHLGPPDSRAPASRKTTATPSANRDTAAAAPKPAPKCPGSTHPPAAPSPAANARGADRKPPDPWARTASPDSGNTKSARSRRARPGAGFHPPPKRLRAAAPRRSRRSPTPRGQRTGSFPKPASSKARCGLGACARRAEALHSAFRILHSPSGQ